MSALSRFFRFSGLGRLLLLGFLSLVVYAVAFTLCYPLIPLAKAGSPADIGAITGYTRQGAAIYVGSLVLLFALYALAMRSAATGGERGTVWIIFGVGIGAALLLSLVYPYGAADVFLYVVRGRVLGIYGYNSSVVPPSQTPVQPYLPFPSEWAAVSSPYGPLWEWVAAGLAFLGDGSLPASLLAFKSWGALCYLASGVLLMDILRRRSPERYTLGLVAFLWNPLVLLETMAMGHNDIFMVFFMLLAIRFAIRARYEGAIAALVLGGLVKYIPLLLLPATVFWMARRLPTRSFWRQLARGLLLSLVLTALIWWPLWPGVENLPFLHQLNRGHYSLGIWLILFLRRLCPGGDFYALGQGITRVAFGVVYAVVLLRALLGRGRLEEHYRGILYAWLVLGAFAFGYWYIVWLVALMPLTEDRQAWLRINLFGCAGLFSVALYTYGDAWFKGQGVNLMLLGGVLVFIVPWVLAYGLDRLLPRSSSPLASSEAR